VHDDSVREPELPFRVLGRRGVFHGLGQDLRLGGVRLHDLRLGDLNLRLGDLRLGELSLGELRLGHLRLGELRLGHLRLGELRLGELRLGDVRLVRGFGGDRLERRERFLGRLDAEGDPPRPLGPLAHSTFPSRVKSLRSWWWRRCPSFKRLAAR
jgi:hypothetical protein